MFYCKTLLLRKRINIIFDYVKGLSSEEREIEALGFVLPLDKSISLSPYKVNTLFSFCFPF